MKFNIVLALTFLMALGSLAENTKGRKSFILPSNSRLRQLVQKQNGYGHDVEDSLADGNIESELEPMSVDVPSAAALKPDSSSGRLFFKKFFLLGKGKETQTPQFIIITQPAAPDVTTSTSPFDPTATFNGTITTSPVDGRNGNISGDYINDDDEDDVYEDEIANEKQNAAAAKRAQHTTYKLVKGRGNQKGLSFVVPTKYMSNFQSNRNTLVVNPSATYNNGASKVKKFVLSNNGNVKRKRSRNPMRRFIVSQK